MVRVFKFNFLLWEYNNDQEHMFVSGGMYLLKPGTLAFVCLDRSSIVFPSTSLLA